MSSQIHTFINRCNSKSPYFILYNRCNRNCTMTISVRFQNRCHLCMFPQIFFHFYNIIFYCIQIYFCIYSVIFLQYFFFNHDNPFFSTSYLSYSYFFKKLNKSVSFPAVTAFFPYFSAA